MLTKPHSGFACPRRCGQRGGDGDCVSERRPPVGSQPSFLPFTHVPVFDLVSQWCLRCAGKYILWAPHHVSVGDCRCLWPLEMDLVVELLEPFAFRIACVKATKCSAPSMSPFEKAVPYAYSAGSQWPSVICSITLRWYSFATGQPCSSWRYTTQSLSQLAIQKRSRSSARPFWEIHPRFLHLVVNSAKSAKSPPDLLSFLVLDSMSPNIIARALLIRLVTLVPNLLWPCPSKSTDSRR